MENEKSIKNKDEIRSFYKILLISLILVFSIFSLTFLVSYIKENKNISIKSEEQSYLSANILDSLFSLFKKDNRVKVLFFGDMMLDRKVRLLIEKNGSDYPFSKIGKLFDEADLVVANLEGSFTDNPSKTSDLKGKYLDFTFDPKMAKELRRIGFDILSLANNHSLNFGREGLDSTKKYIKDAKMEYFGDPENSLELSLIKEIRGIKIAFVGFYELYYKNFQNVYTEIKRIKDNSLADIIIVMPHWGVEYQDHSSTMQRQVAKEMVKSGADIIVGAHPHVVQNFEKISDSLVFYSLGNFVFDQNFSFETTHGASLIFEFEKDQAGIIGMTYRVIPLDIINSEVSVSTGETKKKVLENMGI